MNNRGQFIENILDIGDCDVLLFLDSANLLYFSKKQLNCGCLILHRGGWELFVDFTNYQMARGLHGVQTHCVEHSVWIDAIQWIGENGYSHIGYDPFNIPHAFMLLGSQDPKLCWLDLSEQIATLRSIKDKQEVVYLQIAAQETERALRIELKKLRNGITERKLADSINCRLVELTGEPPAFPTMVAFGENTANPHWISSSKRLSPGDTIIIDCGASVNGYMADLARTYFWKRASARQLRRYQLVLDSLRIAISKVKASEFCCRVDGAVRKHFKEYQLDQYFLHPLGHGVGLEVHESPVFAVDSKGVLMVDMVFALEPGIFIPGWGGIRLEEMIWLSSKGPKLLAEAFNDVPVLD
ncbi:M24 family metallopeptidase [bacterium]|nr:M24 family metallopeptidase [bacterium]